MLKDWWRHQNVKHFCKDTQKFDRQIL